MAQYADQQPANGEPIVEGEHDWIFDCLITFLKSPRWKTPVVSYIEEHCLIFDNEEENKLEYTTIHMNFFKMIDELLCELVAEMGITREQFQEACQTSSRNPTHHRIVQQILSVDDFEAFKKMMIKKNMQINEIAMQELMKKSGISEPSSAQADGGAQQEVSAFQTVDSEQPTQTAAGAGAGNDEDEQMRIVMEMSRVAQEEADAAAREEEEMIRLAIEASQVEEQQRAQHIQKEQEMSNQAIKESEQAHIQAQASAQASAAPQQPREEVKQPEVLAPIQSPQDQAVSMSQPQAAKPKPQVIQANIDPEQQRKEDEKLRQLAELKKKREEEKKNPPKPAPVQAVEPVQQPVIDPRKFREEQKEVISKIRKPDVEEVSAFDDIHSGAQFRQAEDPYAGKSFAEVLRMKREKLDAQLKANIPAPAEPAANEPAAAQEAAQVPAPTGKGETLEARKARLQAQRQALLEKRKQEREKELNDYNKSNSGASLDAARNSFYAQMIKMDSAIPKQKWAPPGMEAQQQPAAAQSSSQPVAAAQQSKPQRAAFNLDDIDGIDIL